MAQTVFFTAIESIAANGQLTLTIRMVDGKMKVSTKMDFTKADKLALPPLMISGTPDQLDEGFIDALTKVNTEVEGLVTNLGDVLKTATTTSNKLKKAAPVKKEETAAGGETGGTDETGTATPPAEKTTNKKANTKATKPEPAKKMPKGVDDLVERLKVTVDEDMQGFLRTQISTKLTEASWSEEEIKALWATIAVPEKKEETTVITNNDGLFGTTNTQEPPAPFEDQPVKLVEQPPVSAPPVTQAPPPPPPAPPVSTPARDLFF